MKYCPFCGTVLPEAEVSYCTECGGELPRTTQQPRDEEPKRETFDMPQIRNAAPSRSVTTNDAYYNDVLPEDYNSVRRGFDGRLLVKIMLLILGGLVLVGLSVLAIIYL